MRTQELARPLPVAAEVEVSEEGDVRSLREIILGVGTQSWLVSFAVHCGIFVVLALVLGTIKAVHHVITAPSFDASQSAPPIPEISHFEVGETPLDPTELSTETLMLTEAPPIAEEIHDNSPLFEPAGGGVPIVDPNSIGGVGAGFDVKALGLGPTFKGAGGIEGGEGFGVKAGKGGDQSGFGTRGEGMREAALGSGVTKASERAVAAALNWLARHQNANGSWSIDHRHACRGAQCSGPGSTQSDGGATALALLPFLAAGQTHQSRGPYQKNILAGINWLIQIQKPDGDLSTGSFQQMYTHGLATIALCEAYGMTQDSRVGYAAQAAINFIQTAQNKQGGWRYSHGSYDSDTSVFGWQVMALKSGQMAKLDVNTDNLKRSKDFLQLVSSGQYNEQFGYQPGKPATLPMTAVGLLTTQYLGAKRGDPIVIGGVEFLSKNLPDLEDRNVYYWYYATQVMHNVPGPEWDKWNRAMRKMLINTQDKNGCESGSWDPDKPSPDPWGRQGGRLMCTSLSCLTLEVYYRYLPLYKLDKDEKDAKPPQAERPSEPEES